MNNDLFIKKSKKIHGNKYDYSLVDYIYSRLKVKIICPVHGIFEISPYSHLNGNGCLICKNKSKFIEKSKKIHGNKYDYSLVEYINQYKKVKIICPKHGIFEQIPKNHYIHECKKCNDDNKRFDKSKFVEKSKKIHGNKYDYSLVKYINSHEKVKIICPKHGIFEQKPYLHLNGKNGCRLCDNMRKKELYKDSTDDFIKKSKKIHGNKYDYSLVEYDGSYNKVKIICPKHGIFEQKPNIHLNKSGCPFCRSSIGETIIKNKLDYLGIKYKKEKIFNDCRNINPLPFDFYLTDYNICIEFDGIQHFKPIKIWGGINQFKYIKNNDNIKNNYCKNNKIKLFRINYNDNIYNKIDELLSNINKNKKILNGNTVI